MNKLLVTAALVLLSIKSFAVSIDWTGGYKLEYVSIEKPTLGDPSGAKSYGLHLLYLQPQIIGSDGINIVSRFDIFGNDIPAYKNSQLGSFWGNGLKRTAGQGTNSNVTSENSDSSNLRISQLYININHEFGTLVAGRAPIDFGIGITHNAGLSAFDHWSDTKDMIGYKFSVDNISFMPILGKVYQSDFGLANTVSDQIFVFEYDNKDIGAKAGVFHQTRKSSNGSNDALSAGYPGAISLIGGFKSQTINVYLERKWAPIEFRLEGSFLTGDTGVAAVSGEEIKLNSYAVAAELLFPANETKWEFLTKLGIVSGDDPTTTAYEGYNLDRNYDVAMLMFNHRVGAADVIGNGPLHSNDGAPNNLSVLNSADDEAIGNGMYLAQSVKYIFSEKISWKNTLAYGQLLTNVNNFVDFKKDLGLELDTEFIYQPRERVTWSTGLGFLFPGAAFKGGNKNYDNKMTYGLTTKAAITF